MTVKLHRVHIPNLGEAIVPQGSGHPFEAAYDVLPPGFNVGDILRLGGKTFVLGKLGGAITGTGFGLKNGAAQGSEQVVLGAAAAAGDKTVILATTATSGAAGTGLTAVDEYKGGTIVLFKAGVDKPQIRGIAGNTARAATGVVNVTFTLDSPLSLALAVTDVGEAMASPWAYLVQDTQIAHPVMGVATVIGTTGQFIWVQTWGPTFVSPQANVGVGGAGIGCYWRHDGSIDVYASIGTYVSTQYAGFVLAENIAHTQGAPFFMLQVMP
jgi:hypothetical protein